MCGPTELHTALQKFSFIVPSANVCYTESKKYVKIYELHEKDLIDLEKVLRGLSNPVTIISISVKYTTSNGKVYHEELSHLTATINARNRGYLKKNKPLDYFTSLVNDTDSWTQTKSDLADDNSTSHGSYKNYAITLEDPEIVVGSNNCTERDNSAYSAGKGLGEASTTGCVGDPKLVV
uniref:Uncharacterized protein n=1 Tax=viral metagenome TaxID=1070528 RepID=A0A6C0DHC1_9ZZZZ